MNPPAIDGFASTAANVGGINLHYWIGGDPDGPPVLLWHGFLGTGFAWHKVAPQLAQAGLAVLVPDMRGYGDSDKPPGNDGYDARALARELRGLVKQTGFGNGRRLTLIAHDMGAPPALLWAGDHPDEISGLMYLEAPVVLQDVLSTIISFNPEAMEQGSMWWWILPLAPGVPERLIAGNERAFLTWFYDLAPSTRHAIDEAAIGEYLRTFSGQEGVLGALGVYRTVFTTVEQTAPLTQDKVRVPVVALGGEHALGDRVRDMVSLVAQNVTGGTVTGCGHFLPEECPEEITGYALKLISET